MTALWELKDGWWYATSKTATFSFLVRGGRVVEAAPYARRWLLGYDSYSAYRALTDGGYKFEWSGGA